MKSIYLNCTKSFILLLSFIISLSQNKENYINMTITGAGKIKILYSSEKPSKVLFNGNNIEYFFKYGDVYANSSEYIENVVVIEFNETINYLDFKGCTRIISIDLSNFDSSSITNMASMFGGCTSLKSLNLNNFSTKNCSSMESMFYNCFLLVSLDLKSFDVSFIEKMDVCFIIVLH